MKKLYLLIIIVMPISIQAQNTEGLVIYEESRQFKLALGSEEQNDEIKSMLPPSVSTYKQLLFTPEASIFLKYENLEKESGNEINFTTAAGGKVNIQMKEPDNKYYRDITNGEIVEKIEFMSKDFIINEPAENFAWKITGETKSLMEYTVMKATLEDTSGVIVAWFTPQIPVSAGPEKYGNLPGLILEMSLDNGERTFVATKVKFESVDKNLLVAPEKGKKVSREEFETIREEKMKEMEEMYGGKGKRTMIIHK